MEFQLPTTVAAPSLQGSLTRFAEDLSRPNSFITHRCRFGRVQAHGIPAFITTNNRKALFMATESNESATSDEYYGSR